MNNTHTNIGLFVASLGVLFLSFCLFSLCYAQDTTQDATQTNSFERKVRVVYFLPNNRTYRQELEDRIRTQIVYIQSFYTNQMAAHGYSGMSIRIERDTDGIIVVNRLDGRFPSSYYNSALSEKQEVDAAFDTKKNIYLVVSDKNKTTGYGDKRSKIGGAAYVGGNFLNETMWNTAAHELGHVFGLPHDFRGPPFIMSYSYKRKNVSISECAAKYLSVHPYFNTSIPLATGTNPIVEILSSLEFTSDVESVPINLNIADNDGLHQIRLFSTSIITCRDLSGTSAKVIFDYDGHSKNLGSVGLSDKRDHYMRVDVIDVHGNETQTSFLLTNTSIPETTNLPPVFTEGKSTRRFVQENISSGRNIGIPVVAIDPENNRLQYSLSGIDTYSFSLNRNTGQLKSRATLDYDMKKKYRVTVNVRDFKGGIDSIDVTINVIPIGQHVKHKQISFSELMYASRGGPESMPQWIELYNNRKDKDIVLTGWTLEIEALDEDGIHRHYVVRLDSFTIPQQQTALIVTWTGRQTDNISTSRVYRFYEYHHYTINTRENRNKVIGQVGFCLKLYDSEATLIDIVGNLDGNPDTEDKPQWEIPAGTTERDLRTSILRRYEIDADVPKDGTVKNNWKRATDLLPLVVNSVWGLATDIGNPGYKSNFPLPVSLSQFRAYTTAEGTLITWTTESELENAGFNILRSNTRNGEYIQINNKLVIGAGTTGNKTQYTWTDTTTKPNVEYYYRIEDVSFKGVKKVLSTARIKGLLSAKNRLVIQWGSLKSKVLPNQ